MDSFQKAFFPKHYNYYGQHLRNKFNAKVFKIIVDAGFTCPNRDGTKGYGGCAYCNVDSFTPEATRIGGSIKEQIIRGMERAKKSYKAEKFIVYFQPNTNTYASVDKLKQVYIEALEVNPSETLGLTIGTRPDCIDSTKLDMIRDITKDKYISMEYGMESMQDETLKRLNRGHTHQEFIDAIQLTKQYQMDICVHTVFGFPGETEEQWLAVADEINRHAIQYIKLHHLYIVKGSVYGCRYKKEPFELFSLEGYTQFLSKFLPKLDPNIVIQRLFGISELKDLIAPNWGLKKTLIQRHIEKAFEEHNIWQGSEFIQKQQESKLKN